MGIEEAGVLDRKGEVIRVRKYLRKVLMFQFVGVRWKILYLGIRLERIGQKVP
jgi:hypothetical protein